MVLVDLFGPVWIDLFGPGWPIWYCLERFIWYCLERERENWPAQSWMHGVGVVCTGLVLAFGIDSLILRYLDLISCWLCCLLFRFQLVLSQGLSFYSDEDLLSIWTSVIMVWLYSFKSGR